MSVIELRPHNKLRVGDRVSIGTSRELFTVNGFFSLDKDTASSSKPGGFQNGCEWVYLKVPGSGQTGRVTFVTHYEVLTLRSRPFKDSRGVYHLNNENGKSN